MLAAHYTQKPTCLLSSHAPDLLRSCPAELDELRPRCRRSPSQIQASVDRNYYHLPIGGRLVHHKSIWTPLDCGWVPWVCHTELTIAGDTHPQSRGNWTLPNGQAIAKVYPNVGGDSGVQDNTGVLHVDTRMTWKLDDGHYVWMHALGQGVAYVSDDLYM